MAHPGGRSIARLIHLAVLTVALVGMAISAVPEEHISAAPKRASASAPNIDLYRGLGSWVDIYEKSSWADPEGAVRAMHAHEVGTLYIETSNYKREQPIKFAKKQSRFVEAAHSLGMKVVAWYLPGFGKLDRDFNRSMAAIDFETPGGQHFDSFALDIESPNVESQSLRTKRLLTLSDRLRRAVGSSYALGAIIPSPRGIQKHPEYWAHFPYAELTRYYDLFLPMTYFTWREETAHRYTTENIRIIRNETGDPTVPIHVIGGISEEASPADTAGFVHAVREAGVIGGSYYGFAGTTRLQWRELERIPTNPNQDPPLPIRLPYSRALGNTAWGDHSHPKDVVYKEGPLAGPLLVSFQAFDVQPGEVTLRVNWHRAVRIEPTGRGAWSETRTLRIPGTWLLRRHDNFLVFTARGRAPDWSRWAVRGVKLTRP